MSCSAEAYRHEADAEVYDILAAKRSLALGRDAENVPFRVEEKENRLRKQLEARIAKGETPKVTITLAEALEIAAENSRDFQDQKERLFNAALGLTGQRNRYATIFRGTSDATVNGTGDDTAGGSVRSSLTASKILASGANILGSFVNSFFRVFTTGGGWNTSSLLNLSITQPLLRGFGSEVTLEPLTQAERDAVYAIRNYERFRRTFCVQIVSTYLNVLEQENAMQNNEANYRSLQENERRTAKTAEGGRLPKFQVDQATQQALAAQDRLIGAQTRLATLLDRFKITLGLPTDIELTLQADALEQLRALGVSAVALDESKAVQLALQNRLDLRNAHEQVVDAERMTRVAADALRLGLDLSAGANVANKDPKKAARLDWKRIEWQAGLALDLPLNRVNERNAYRRSLIALAAERRRLSLLEDSVKQAVRDALRAVQAANRSYAIQQNAVNLATERVKSTTMLIDAGRASTRDYLEAEQSLLQSQNALTNALVDYVINKLGLLRDLELLSVGSTGLSLDMSTLNRWNAATPGTAKERK